MCLPTSRICVFAFCTGPIRFKIFEVFAVRAMSALCYSKKVGPVFFSIRGSIGNAWQAYNIAIKTMESYAKGLFFLVQSSWVTVLFRALFYHFKIGNPVLFRHLLFL